MKKAKKTKAFKIRAGVPPAIPRGLTGQVLPLIESGKKKGSKAKVLFASLLLIGLIDYVDFVIGSPIHLSALMIVPLGLTVWYVGLGWGLSFSVLASFYALLNYAVNPRFYTSLWIPYWNGMTLFVLFAAFCFVLDILKKELVKVAQAAFTDRLSGLLSAQAFFEMAEKERVLAQQRNEYFTLCVLDLDNFKKVNDTLGHLKGDELLKKMATILKSRIREHDLASRLGGDEFAVLFPHTGLESANTLTSKLRQAIADGLRNGDSPSVTPSIGAIICFRVPDNLKGVVRAADFLMYEAKKAGRNQVKVSILGRRSEDAKSEVFKKAFNVRTVPKEDVEMPKLV